MSGPPKTANPKLPRLGQFVEIIEWRNDDHNSIRTVDGGEPVTLGDFVEILRPELEGGCFSEIDEFVVKVARILNQVKSCVTGLHQLITCDNASPGLDNTLEILGRCSGYRHGVKVGGRPKLPYCD